MGKYLVLWEVDPARVPIDPKERATAWLGLTELVKADMKTGWVKDWGTFPGELKGYAIDEGSEVTMMTETTKYAPYVKFEVHPVATLAEVQEAIKAAVK